ncbi:MAG: hypothetical protein Q9225_006463 [Loekoesia sp. 1 TL-2023]
MLPLGLLNAAQGHPMLVELKNGETLNGHLINCDTWMNLTLKEVVQTNPEGTAFFRLPEVYVRGNNIKYLRVPDEIIDLVKDQQQNQPSSRGRGGDVGYADRSRHGKTGEKLRTGHESFFSGHHVELDASGHAIALARSSKKPRDVNEGNERQWGPKPRFEKTTIPKQKTLEAKPVSRETRLPDNDRGLPGKKGPLEGLEEPAPQSLDLNIELRGYRVRYGRGYSELSEEETYEEMRRASAAGDYPRLREVLKIMIEDRGEKPNRKHYQALLLANTSAQHGSAAEVVRTLQDMEDAGITLDSASYHAVLRVLAIHPDHLFRGQILDELRQRWFSLSNEGWHDVIVGLLRDKQAELAIETLQNVQQEGIRVAPWLYDMLIYNLCDVGEYDEALSILRFRVDNGEQLMSGTVWYYLLDSASRALHYAATLYAWRKRVEMSYLNPSSGICLNVLNTAARHGDSHLARDVVRVLGNRNQTLQLYHYEALVESYLPSDLRTAFTLLTLMTSHGMPPTDLSTRALFLHLRQSPHLPQTALSILRKLREENRPIPVEAVNVVIESYIDHGNLDAALEAYKTLHTLCPSGPATSTFNRLFRGCRGRKDEAMFLASEMVALNVLPDALTYDRLILVCMGDSSDRGQMDDAWQYFEEMRGAGCWPRPGTTMAMAQRSCQLGDERIWRLQGEEGGEVGIERSVLKKMADADWMKGKGTRGSSRILEMMDAEDPWA